jgi:hypothetical protein
MLLGGTCLIWIFIMTMAVCCDVASSSHSFKIFKNSFLYNKWLVGFSDHSLFSSCDSVLFHVFSYSLSCFPHLNSHELLSASDGQC